MDRSLPHAVGKAAVKVNGNVQLLALKQDCGKNSGIEFLVGVDLLCKLSQRRFELEQSQYSAGNKIQQRIIYREIRVYLS